jgi:hypothetical protein
MKRTALGHVLWIVAAGLLSFLSSFVFADLLRLPRGWFLLPHVTLIVAFLIAYARWSGTDLRQLWSRRLALGIVGAGIIGLFLALNVAGQPPGTPSKGAALWFDLLWLGLVYGAVDGLLLSAMPIIAAWRAGKLLGWTAHWPGRIGVALLAIVASVFVTVAYHLGYPECRGSALYKPIVGNTIMSVGQVLTASPVGRMAHPAR